jgi:hypothetical protein
MTTSTLNGELFSTARKPGTSQAEVKRALVKVARIARGPAIAPVGSQHGEGPS